MNDKKKSLGLLFSGIIPIALFWFIEDQYGVIPGLIAAMLFSCGEIIYEKIRFKKVENITWISSVLVFGTGLISALTADGLWFKLQPAIMEFLFFIFLFFSWFMKKPFLKVMMLKQNPHLPQPLIESLSGITLRLSLFFLVHTLLAVYAALYWTTSSWALLKGVGLTVSMILYMVIEFFLLRKRMIK